jgi:hypothetical protein
MQDELVRLLEEIEVAPLENPPIERDLVNKEVVNQNVVEERGKHSEAISAMRINSIVETYTKT